MNHRVLLPLLVIAVSAAGLGGCVSKKKYEALERRANTLADSLTQANKAKAAQLDELNAALDDCGERVDALVQTRDSMQSALRRKEREIASLTAENTALKNESTRELRDLAERIEELRQELYTREQLLAQARQRLALRDSALANLQRRLRSTLMAVGGEGLSVVTEDGRLRISLPEALVFESGETTLDPTGKATLREFAAQMKLDTTMTITVEGHADSLPVARLACIEDNWALSVMRAVEVVRFLTGEAGLPTTRLRAAGRADADPIAPNRTEAGRAKNRRIEIWVTPDLAPLYKLLEESGAPSDFRN